MKTKYQYLITCLILLACSCIVVTNLTAEKTLTTASWANYYANVNEMKNAADIVIQGTVSSSVSSKYYYPDGSNRYMIVTNHILNVEKLLSGELAENKIIIFQTGGKIGTETSQIV
ncbi:MAG TPA: hypothetical protein VM050_10285, partial [Patescibacteria group bacterium]|nr:hypothetical protein [Patescibacteria group bacterium]